MAKGTVKWFDDSKGHGFITVDGSILDVRVAYDAIQKEGYRSLEEGERVEFEIVESQKGPQAERVRSI